MVLLSNIRWGHSAATAQKRATVSRMVKRADCGSDLYTGPAAGDVVTTTKPTTLSWNTACFNPAPKFVDIYLYAPGTNKSLIQAFNSAEYAKGSYETTLDASWWGSTPNVNLQLTIVQHGTPNFLATANGPIFSATYNSSAPSTSSSTTNTSSDNSPAGTNDHGIIQDVKNILHGLGGGSIAAAVIVPLLVIGLGIALFIKFRRGRQLEKTKRFSQAVDKRMSTISTDWRSMSGASANAAIRNSVHTSAFGRPSSTFSTVGGGQAGIGAARFGGLQTSEEAIPQMSQLRQPRASAYGSTERISRVSFAADARFSVNNETQPPLPSPPLSRLQATRSYHQGHSFDEPRETDEVDARELQMSPTQTQGPFSLSAADITARASGDDEDFRKEVLQMPAMTMMRTGHRSSGAGEDLFIQSPGANSSFGPSMPSPVLHKSAPLSPMSMTLPVNALSPDDMLRAYASGRANTPVTPSVLGSGASMSSGQNTGMRILYAPSDRPSPATEDTNPFRKSMARTTMYTESMYSGMADEDVDAHHHPTAQ